MLAPVASLVGAAEERLRPLTLARNIAWWNSSVEATDENARLRAEAELAYSDALADSELFAQVEAELGAGGDAPDKRSLELLYAQMLPHQIPSALRSRLVELEADVES